MKIRDKNIYSHDRKNKSKNIVTSCYHYSQMHLHYIIQLQSYVIFDETLSQHKFHLRSQHKQQAIIIEL